MARKPRSLKLRSSNPESAPKLSPFHAVEIRCGEDCCAAARDSRGERYLGAEAPRLPLAACDRASRCTCSYRHYDDRRHSRRRAADVGGPSTRPEQGDQRSSDGRRADDREADLDLYDPLEDTYYDFIEKKPKGP